MTTTMSRTPTRSRVCRVAASLAIAGAAAAGIGFVTAAPASAAVTPIGTINGHPAFAIGPHGDSGACAATANRLSGYGAKKFGPTFGTCYRAAGGSWYAISPWSA